MPKVRRPQDVGVIVPSKPVIEADNPDEDDDDHLDAASDEGLLSAAEDLSVLDFFAAIATIPLISTSSDVDHIAKRAYEVGIAMVAERARIESVEEDDAT